MNIDCPCCGKTLKLDDIDNRQEWTECTFHCPSCEKEYTYREDYEIQSHKITACSLCDETGKDYYNVEN